MSIDTHPDNAIVNIPLSRRGNIDAQIDRFKADQGKAARAGARSQIARIKALRQQAKLQSDRIPLMVDRMMAIARERGTQETRSELRRRLTSMQFHDPSTFLKAARDFAPSVDEEERA